MYGVFNINSGRLGTSGYMMSRQVAALSAGGNEIGGHTVTHADLPTHTAERRRQVCNDRVTLLNADFQPYDFAYPYGDTSSATSQIVVDCGYNSARGVGGIGSPGSCSGCHYAEKIPLTDSYNLITPASIKSNMSLHYRSGLSSMPRHTAVAGSLSLCTTSVADAIRSRSVSPHSPLCSTGWPVEPRPESVSPPSTTSAAAR